MAQDHESIDPVEQTVGSFGKWQIYIILITSIVKMPVSWHSLGIVFLAPPVQYWCTGTEDDPTAANRTNFTNVDQCSFTNQSTGEEVKCSSWEYDRSIFKETIITEWNLVCDEAQLANIAQMLFMFGVLLGNVFFGMAADKFGRKLPLIFASILQIIGGVCATFAPNYAWFVVIRFFDALAVGGMMITTFIICMEIVGEKWRGTLSLLTHIPFSLAHSLMPVVSYYLRGWREFQLATSLPSILLLVFWWTIPESPRWLLAVGRDEQAITILEAAAKRNKKDVSQVAPNIRAYLKQGKSEENKPKGSLLDLFRTPNMRTKTLCLYYIWLVCGLCFYGLAQYMGQLAGDIFLNVAISGLIEIPGGFICSYMMTKWGRKKTMIISQFLSGVSCLLIMAALGSSEAWPQVLLSSIGVVGMSVAFPTAYMYAGELFPTVVRNVGVGSSSMCARVGSMSAPFITTLNDIHIYLPPLIFGIGPLIAALVCIPLPETAGHVLPDTVEEGESFGRKIKKRKNIGEINQNFHREEDDIKGTKL